MKNKINTGGQIFPHIKSKDQNKTTSQNEYIEGISLRDYFAAKAMQGLVSHPDCKETVYILHGIGKEAYQIADAMIKARNK